VTVRHLAADGRTVVFISHKLNEVKAVADRVTVLRRGRSVATVDTADHTARELASLMVGREVAAAQRVARSAPVGERVVLEAMNLWVEGDRGAAAVRDVSLTVNEGEILAVAGVAGNGQRELAEAIIGMRPRTGRIRLDGEPLAPGDPREAIRRGIADVPEDRLGTGLAPSLSVAENLVLKDYRESWASRGPFLRRRRLRRHAEELIARYEIKTPAASTPARMLSGGNLQKVVLAREFAGEPKLLVAASPTRGLDVGAIETVHRLLREAAAGGVGVLLLSEDLDEILTLADRVAVIYEGRIVGTVAAEGASVHELGLMMAGGHGERA
jgi:simple sugar transport system ATP-binding protein